MLNCRRRSCMPTTKSHTGSPTWVMAAMFQICPNDMMAASCGGPPPEHPQVFLRLVNTLVAHGKPRLCFFST
jgi:hypothetical protein